MTTAEDYEAAFHGIDLPQYFEFAPGASTSDVQSFLEKSLTILRNGNSERVAEPIRWRLDALLEFINSENEKEN